MVILTLSDDTATVLPSTSVKTESSSWASFESDSSSSSDSLIVVATSMNLVVDDLRLIDLA